MLEWRILPMATKHQEGVRIGNATYGNRTLSNNTEFPTMNQQKW